MPVGALSGLARLGDMTDQEAMDIIKTHFQELPAATTTQIAMELATGNTATLSAEVKKITEKICKAGIVDKAASFYEANKTWLIALGAAIAGYGIYKMASK